MVQLIDFVYECCSLLEENISNYCGTSMRPKIKNLEGLVWRGAQLQFISQVFPPPLVVARIVHVFF